MWQTGWREKVWSVLDQPWDIIIVGGGITGAGILREASRLGLRTLLLEARDFSSGTSSRSSKLVHGGFRYLKNAQLKVTLQSVSERERLLKEGRGLVTQLGFLMPVYATDKYPAWLLGMGLSLYDLLAFDWKHRYYRPQDLLELCPCLSQRGLKGGYRFFDAQTDDARLVLRLIRESLNENSLALNYAQVCHLLTNNNGQVRGVVVNDVADESFPRQAEVKAGIVINATGAWADNLRITQGFEPKLRKLRGSHIVFPFHRLPITRAISFWHPRDHRPVFALPWEGVTLFGTTDVEQAAPLPWEPRPSPAEIEYLLLAINHIFPQQDLAFEDIQACFAGIRPVVATGKTDPSKESREHILLCEDGMLTITGGKLTTFRLMARDALQSACSLLGKNIQVYFSKCVLDPISVEILSEIDIKPSVKTRILGRYGPDAPAIMNMGAGDDFEEIDSSKNLWVELRWVARHEGVVHLDDLLFRRVRLGLLLPQGGSNIFGKIREYIQPELGWTDDRWSSEVIRYMQLWQCGYSTENTIGTTVSSISREDI